MLSVTSIANILNITFDRCPEPGCEKVFFSSSCMTIHMKIHQLSPDDLRCKYPGCGKQFNVLCRLKQHEKLHTGEKPYVCDYKVEFAHKYDFIGLMGFNVRSNVIFGVLRKIKLPSQTRWSIEQM